MILIINTAEVEILEIILAQSAKNFSVKKISASGQQSEKLLTALDGFLRTKKISPQKLTGLGVVSGPGGFTSIRVGVVVANSLAWALKLPIAGVSKNDFKNNSELVSQVYQKLKAGQNDKIVLPVYERELKIRKSG